MSQPALSTPSKWHRWHAATIYLLAALFYFYDFSIQVAPGVMTAQLMQQFGVGAAGLAIFSASYFYGYAPFQLPAGLLHDRFGPRKVLTLAIALCSLGTLALAFSHDFTLAIIARFSIGVGSAFAFIGALVLIDHWFDAKYFAVLAGFVQFIGSMGAIFGEAPFAYMLQTIGQQASLLLLASAGFTLMVLIALIVRDHPAHTDLAQLDPILPEAKKLAIILKQKHTWWIGAYVMLLWTPVVMFTTQWGVPYLSAKFGLHQYDSAFATSFIWIGVGLGCPAIGAMSLYVKNRTRLLASFSAIGFLATSYLFYCSHLSLSIICLCLFLLGLAGAGQSLTFAIVKDNIQPNCVATAVAFNNMVLLFSGAVFHPIVGALLDYHWNDTFKNGVPFYTGADYQYALLVVPSCFFATFIISQFLIKTRR